MYLGTLTQNLLLEMLFPHLEEEILRVRQLRHLDLLV